MATDLALDDALLDEAVRIGGRRTKKDTVTEALDFLLCATCERHRMPLFTTDADFTGFARVLPFRLHEL